MLIHLQCGLTVLVVALVAVSSVTLPDDVKTTEALKREWWEKTVFYQIYPRSFKDSDGDGVGDLIGIKDSLKHLPDIGVYATWLSPIFKSPMVDFGYDCSDFRQIDPTFGTMKDIEDLIAEANRLGIKIILDFVPNHTSDQHDWFVKSENREAGYEDFYVWRNSSVPGKKAVPNNWVSVFSGPAWTWSDKRQQFYYHQFAKQQPDLNYRSNRVIEEMIKILDFWIEKGVYGFRVDAVNHLYEDSEFRDDIQVGKDPLNHDHFDHPHTKDMPESNEMVFRWREHFEKWSKANNKENILLMTEAYTSRDLIMSWYQSKDGSKKGSHVPFNFIFIMDLVQESKPSDFKKAIDVWIDAIPAGHYPNWVMGNHDRPRAGTRFSKSFIDSINIIAMTLPGFAVTYYGEEIGMLSIPYISWEDTQDPQGCLTNREVYHKYSRDPVRSPFQWDATQHAGFSNTSRKTWLPVHPEYKINNLAAQKASKHSHYTIYKQLTELRKHPTFISSNFKSLVLANDNVLAYKRFADNHTTFYVVINFDYKMQVVNLKEFGAASIGTVEVSGVSSQRRNGDPVELHDLRLGGYEVLVLRAGASATTISTWLFSLVISFWLFN